MNNSWSNELRTIESSDKYIPDVIRWRLLYDWTNLRKFAFNATTNLFRWCDSTWWRSLKRARTRSNEPSRQSAIDQPHFREISPWKRRRMNRVPRACGTVRANTKTVGCSMHKAVQFWRFSFSLFLSLLFPSFSFSPFLSFLFIDVSSGRVHLLIRTSCTKKTGSVSLYTRYCSDKKITGTVTLRLSLGRSNRRQRGCAGKWWRKDWHDGWKERDGHSVGSKSWQRWEDWGRRGQVEKKEKSSRDDEGDVLYRSHLKTSTFCCRGLLASFSFRLFFFFLFFLVAFYATRIDKNTGTYPLSIPSQPSILRCSFS